MSKERFNWKRFWATVVIVFIAFIFTVSIFISYGGRGGSPLEMETIAEVNGKPVEFYGNSPVVREYERLRNIYKTRTKEELLRKAVQNVIGGMLLEDFAKHNGFDLSEEFVDKITAENVYGLLGKREITSADLKMARLNVESFLKSSYLTTKVDTFISRIPKKSQVGFYNFKIVDDLKISMDIVIFNEVEFMRVNELKTNSKDIENYYVSNYKEILLDSKLGIKVEKYTFSDRKTAYSFISNGIGQIEEKTIVELSPEKNKNIITGLPDDINSFSKPFFENRKYVVYKIVSIPSIDTLPKSVKDYISLKYVLSKSDILTVKYSEDIKNILNEVKLYLARNEINKLNSIPGVNFFRTGEFSAIKALTDFIPDQRGEAIDLPRGIYNIQLIVSWFRKSKNDIDVSDIGQQNKVVYKIVDKKVVPSKVSEVADKIFSSYEFIYQESIYSEWNRMLEKGANIKIKDISKFAKEL